MTTERKVLSLRRDTTGMPQITERLHKVLANAGLGSRRSIEERIAAGEIRINGEVAQIGAQLNNGDRVEIDGRRFAAVPCTPEEIRVLVYNKPEGLVTTQDDPEGRATVFEKLPRLKGARWVSVGRLDINTTGLLLLTTDGELANALMHPSKGVEREYVCRVFGEVTDAHLAQLKAGVELEDGPAAFDDIVEIHRDERHSWFRVLLSEGRNREVRRLWEALGLMVSRLKRIRYGIVELPRELRRGHYRALDAEQVRELRHSVGLDDAPQSLTLDAVVGQRRAPARSSNEYRPEPKAQRAWTGASMDEARELRAFDRPLLDDSLGRRKKRPAGAVGKRGKAQRPAGAAGRGRPGAGGAGAGPAGARGKPAGRGRARQAGAGGAPGERIERGNRADRPAGGAPERRQRKPRTLTGPMDSNEMLFRTWYPGDAAGNVASPRKRPDDDDNRGNRIGEADGNRSSSRPATRRPRPSTPGNGNGPAPREVGNDNGNVAPRPPGNRPARKPGKPHAGRGPGGNVSGKAAPTGGDGDNRQRRGPFGRARKRPGGKTPEGGGSPSSDGG